MRWGGGIGAGYLHYEGRRGKGPYMLINPFIELKGGQRMWESRLKLSLLYYQFLKEAYSRFLPESELEGKLKRRGIEIYIRNRTEILPIEIGNPEVYPLMRVRNTILAGIDGRGFLGRRTKWRMLGEGGYAWVHKEHHYPISRLMAELIRGRRTNIGIGMSYSKTSSWSRLTPFLKISHHAIDWKINMKGGYNYEIEGGEGGYMLHLSIGSRRVGISYSRDRGIDLNGRSYGLEGASIKGNLSVRKKLRFSTTISYFYLYYPSGTSWRYISVYPSLRWLFRRNFVVALTGSYYYYMKDGKDSIDLRVEVRYASP